VTLHHALDYKINEISRNTYLVGEGILREEPFLLGVETGYPEFTNNVVSRNWWKQRFGKEPQADDPLWQQVIARQVETASGRSLGNLMRSLYPPRESP